MVLWEARLLFFINNCTVFPYNYNNSPTMRSKQRRTNKQDRSPVTPFTPNPHLLHRFSPDAPPSPQFPKGSQSPSQGGSAREGRIEVLLRENNDLRREIVELKVQQFYHFDDGKLKGLIQELESLRKEVRKQQQTIVDLQTQNDFLRRTNAQLKLELQKEIAARTKDSYVQDISKCTLPKNNLSRTIDDELTHIGSCSHFNSTALTLEEALQDYRHDQPRDREKEKNSRSSRKKLVEKCLSPRRGVGGKESESANQYLLYRRGKDKNLLDKLNE